MKTFARSDSWCILSYELFLVGYIFKPSLRLSSWLKFPCLSVCLKIEVVSLYSLVCSATTVLGSWASTQPSGSSLTSGPFWQGECHHNTFLSPFTSFWLSANVSPKHLCPPCRCAILYYIPQTDAIPDKETLSSNSLMCRLWPLAHKTIAAIAGHGAASLSDAGLSSFMELELEFCQKKHDCLHRWLPLKVSKLWMNTNEICIKQKDTRFIF